MVRVALETGSSASKAMVARWALTSYWKSEVVYEVLALPDSTSTFAVLSFSSRVFKMMSFVGLVMLPVMLEYLFSFARSFQMCE